MNDRQTELKEHSAHIFEMGCMEQRVYLKNDVDAVIEAKDAEIAKMNARIEELEESQRWRKFSEEKPKEKQWILVYYPNHSNFTTGVEVRRWDEGCKYDVEQQEVYDKWMPLPKAPEDE